MMRCLSLLILDPSERWSFGQRIRAERQWSELHGDKELRVSRILATYIENLTARTGARSHAIYCAN